MNRTSKAFALLAAAATVTGLGAAPAAADTASYSDPADMGGASLNDLRRVTLAHDADLTTVRVKVTDLRRRSDGGSAGLTIRIDTRDDRSGPEFRLTTGMYAGTDYQLQRIRHGQPVGDPLSCKHGVALRFAADRVVFRAAPGCLRHPDQVRIGVKMTDLYDGSHPVTDWLGGRHSWTDWVSAG